MRRVLTGVLLRYSRRITRSSKNSWCCAPAGVFAQRAAFDQIEDVAVGRILRAFGELGPFGCREFALEAVEQSIEHFDLAFVERLFGEGLPELRFCVDRAERFLGSVYSTQQAGEEPVLPARDI